MSVDRLEIARAAEAIVRPLWVRHTLSKLRDLLAHADDDIVKDGRRVWMTLNSVGPEYFQAMRWMGSQAMFSTAAELPQLHEVQPPPREGGERRQRAAPVWGTHLVCVSAERIAEEYPAEYFDMKCILDSLSEIVATELAEAGRFSRFDLDERMAVMETVVPWVEPWMRFWATVRTAREQGKLTVWRASVIRRGAGGAEVGPAGGGNGDGDGGGGDGTGDQSPDEAADDTEEESDDSDEPVWNTEPVLDGGNVLGA